MHTAIAFARIATEALCKCHVAMQDAGEFIPSRETLKRIQLVTGCIYLALAIKFAP